MQPDSLQLNDFVRRFGNFLTAAETRIRELEAERMTSVTSNRLLAYRKDKIEAMLHALPEGVVVIDDSCIPTFANGKLEPLLGATPEQIVGKPPHTWCQPARGARLHACATRGSPLRAARRPSWRSRAKPAVPAT